MDVSHTVKSACKITAACKASEDIQEITLWSKDLLLNTILTKTVSKLERTRRQQPSTPTLRRVFSLSLYTHHGPTPHNVYSPVKAHEQRSSKKHLIKTSTCSQKEAHARKIRRK
ncbi:hypothetical protein AOLI_G00226460 [Acnodon oligacanthus]